MINSDKWEVVKLGEICNIQAGGTPSRNNVDYWQNGNIHWVKIGDLNGKYLDETQEKITNKGLENSSTKLFSKGTLLYTIFATLGEVSILRIDACTNQAIAGIKIISNNLLVEYLYYFLISIKFQVNNIGRGVAQNNINLSILKSIEIPLPPLEKQKKIADELDKITILIEKRKTQIEKLDLLVKAKFINYYSTNSVFYNNWQVKSIAEICESKKGSMRTGPFGSSLLHSEFVNSGVFVLGIDNAVANKFSYNKMRYITHEKYTQLKNYTVYPNDVIITIMGTVGRSAVVPNDIPLAINTKHLACLTLNKLLANPIYISYCIHAHPEVLHQIRIHSKGAIMDGLNLTLIKSIKVPLPPINLQNQFADYVEKIEELKEDMQKGLIQLETLYKQRIQEYFE